MDHWLGVRARTHPRTAAVVTGYTAVSYAELHGLARTTARRIAAAGVGAGDRVATTLPPGVDFAAVLHALPLLGAILVPLDTRLSTGERRRRVEDSGARLVVEEPPAGEEADVALREEADPAAPHSVIYTSGTTGRSKGVVLTHRNHEASALASAWNLGVDPDDRWLCVLPLFHVGGLAILVRSAVYGTTAVLRRRFDADDVRTALETGEATLVSLVPTMLRRLAEAGLGEAPALRAALVGGGPVPRDLLEWSAERGLPVLQTYGMTETASQIATLSAGEAVRFAGSAGRPLPGVKLRIGAGGEILVRGPMVSPGAVVADGWLHTADRGRLDEEGRLWVEGRLDDVIVTGGENVIAGEVEAVLLEHEGVREAAVHGEPDAEWGEVVVATVVAEPGAQLDPEDLREHCRRRVARFKVPKRVRIAESLPRTATGKLLRR